MTEFDITYFHQWGRRIRIAHQFMWSSGLRVSEFEEGMTMRSDALVSLLRLTVFTNTFAGNTSFSLRKNGDNINAQTPSLEAHRFSLLPGETGVFETGLTFQYDKDDLICYQFFEALPNATIDFRISCRIQFKRL